MLTTVLAHLLPDKGTDLLLLPGMKRDEGPKVQRETVQLGGKTLSSGPCARAEPGDEGSSSLRMGWDQGSIAPW